MRHITLITFLLLVFGSCIAPNNQLTVASNSPYLLVVLKNNKVYAINTIDPKDVIDVTDRFKGLFMKSIGPISTTRDRVLYTAMRANNREIGVVNADASQQFLTNDPAADYSPVWSPDGRRIAFLSERRQRSRDQVPTEGNCESCDLFILDLSNHIERRVYESATRLSRPLWMGNASLIFAQSQAASVNNVTVDQIKLLNIEDNKIVNLVEAQHDPPAMFGISVIPIEISPDYHQLLYQLNIGQSVKLQRLSLKSMQTTNILPDANGLFEVTWSDSDHLLWLRQNPNASADRPILQLHDLTTGSTINLSAESEVVNSPSMSPSGQHIAYISASPSLDNHNGRNALVIYDLKSHQQHVEQLLPANATRIIGWITGTWAKGKKSIAGE